jgi:serine/threonine protein kinase
MAAMTRHANCFHWAPCDNETVEAKRLMSSENNTDTALESDRQAAESVAVSRLLARLSDRYVVDRKLGCGGTGEVFLARDAKLGRPVAIKVLHPEVSDRIGVDTFQREVRLTAALQHPHILQVLDSGCVDSVCYYIIPFLTDGSLRDLIESDGRLSAETAIRITVDVLEALDYAHAQGLVHCDIKPENILLSNGHAVLADFGIARSTVRPDRHSGTYISGSPAYMSPEQAAGESRLDGRSDLYSLACVLFEMLAGTPAFTGPHALAIIAKRFRGPAPLLSDVCPAISRGLSAAVARTLSSDPAHRYQRARDFAAALLSTSTAARRSWRRDFGGRSIGRTVAKLTRSAIFALSLLVWR